ncbi:MAG: fibronectin type III domain-containing protein [Gemmatimonadota bacterium]|nr:fibronectin type III domain-containing protein [Gemmatimonadota bacterium]
MIPIHLRLLRLIPAAAAAFSVLFIPGSAGARQGLTVFSDAGESAPRVRLPSDPVGAVAPTVDRWELDKTRDDYEEFDVIITWSEDVEGFRLSDIDVDDGTAIDLTGSGDRYTLTIEPDEIEGYVTITIRAGGVEDEDGEENAEEEERFEIDNRRPEFEDATVDGDELVMVYHEDLDEGSASTPSPGDFTVEVEGDDVDVDDVEVDRDEVILTLESPVEPDDDVRVSYDHGIGLLQDEAGNLAEELRRERVDNITKQATGTPGPPRSLTASADGASVIELDWREPSDPGDDDVTGYRIEYSTDAGDTWQTLEDDTDDTRTSYRDTRLSPGTTRHYRVAAINRHGTGAWSNVADATTSRVPGRPTRLTATARGTSRIELDWTAPSSAGGLITGYRIEVSPTGTGRWTVLETDTESRTTRYTDTDLDPGTRRYYRVAAINAAGRGAWSSVADATTDATAPGAPTGLSAVPSGLGGRTQLLLTWTRPSTDGGGAITGYRIEMSANRISWTTLEANTGTTGTSYPHGGLAPATTRYYRVAAINAEGVGPYSNVATGRTNAGAPDAPGSLRARADGPRSITLTWEAPTNDNGARVTGYRIRARRAEETTWTTIRGNTNSTATTFTHTRLEPATAWRYQVAAINSVGVGPWSLEAGTATNPDVPSAPTGLTAQAVGTSRIDLVWRAPANTGGARVLGYRVEASSDGGRTWRIIRSNTGSRVAYYSHRNLQPGATWHYRVSAINAAGLGTASAVASATTEATIPGAPRHLSAVADGTSEIDLSWQRPSSDGGAAVTGYRVEVSANGGASWQTLVANTRSTSTTYSHTGLAPATTRHYRVSAINRVGVGSTSGVANATTDATVPDPPTGLTATATSPTQIDLAWTAPAYDGGASVTGYRIEVSETGQNWGILVSDTRVTGTTYAHTGLLPGSQRFYRVSAINRAGAGDPSNVASAATDDPVERAGRLNTTVLPHVAGAMASSTVGAIADRVDAVASGMGMDRRVDMGGLSSMASSLSSPGAGLGRRERSGLATLFGGTSFQTPLGASDAAQQAGSTGQLATWGAGEYHHMGEPGASVLDWSGSMVSAHVGADTRVAADILAGVAASHSSGTFDFTDRTGASPVAGTYGTAMTSINPYVAWFPGERGNAAWGTAGFGWGDIEVEDEREDLRTSPARMMTGAAGGSYQLMESAIGGVRIKAEGWAGRVLVDGGPRIDSVTLDMQRARLALEWTQGYRSAGGNEVALVLEGGMRYDNGDGINGAGAEVGGGVRYRNVGLGLTAEGRGRLLIAARDGYEEWGFGGMIQLDPATRGQGLQVRVAPSYGDAASGVNQLWERGVSGAVHDRALDMGANVDAEVAYGLAGFHGTPYGGFRLSESGARAFSSGLRYDLGSGLGLRIEGTRREGVLGGAEHTVGVRGRLRLR